MTDQHENTALNIIVFGASGDLSRRKIFPALFSLYCRELLPENTQFIGFSRSAYSHNAFREMLRSTLTCRYEDDDEIPCNQLIKKFLHNCYYYQGKYDSSESYDSLFDFTNRLSGENGGRNLFYYAVPPELFDVISDKISHHISDITKNNPTAWNRVVIEKPFGRDRESSDNLMDSISKAFTEDKIYRIDHYLGKQMVQNLLVLRFANQILSPIWNRKYIEGVDILWAERYRIPLDKSVFNSILLLHRSYV